MSSILEKQNKIIAEFKEFDSWEEKYKYIISIGKNLPEMPGKFKTDSNKVKACQSQVWLFAELTPENRIHFLADSDALIVKGLIALLLKVYDLGLPADILKAPPQFISEIDLGSHLSPSRANGLNAMIKQIMNFAIAFEMITKSKTQ